MNIKPIKVLHVLGKRPVGGVGTFLKNMNSNINLNLLEFDYLISSKEIDGDFDRYVSCYKSKVYVLPELKHMNLFKYLKELNCFMRKNASNYDIIHIHTPNIAVFNLFFAKKYKIKLRIIHSHSIKYSDNILKSFRNFILQIPIRHLANAYMACSVDSAKFLFKNKLIKNEVTIINNAINTDDYIFNQDTRYRKRKELGIENCFVIGQIGSFLPVKNHTFSIDIMNELKNINNNSVMIFVGDGLLENEIKEKAEKLNLSNHIKFLGRRDDVKELLQAMDIMIIPSLFEGIPLVGIEAQVSGLPIVLSDSISKDLQIIDSVNYTSIKESPRVWAEIINKAYVLENKRDINQDIFKNSGYDIVGEAKRLTEAYVTYLAKLK